MQKENSKISAGKILRYAVTFAAIGLMVWLLARQDWTEIWLDVQKIGMGRFALAFGLMIGSRIFISMRWYFLLSGSEGNISLPAALKIAFAGLFSNNFMPSTVGGDVIRLGGAVQAGVSGALSAASLVMDRIVGIIGMAAFLPFGLPYLLAYTPPASSLTPALAFSAAGGSGGGPAGSLPKKLFARGKALVEKLFRAMVLWLRRPQTLLMPLVATFLHMACLFGVIWVILTGLGEQISFWTVGGLWSMVYFVTLIPISINGLGVQELSITFVYTTLTGVTEPHSLTLALLFRTMMMVASLPGALFLGGVIEKQKEA